MVRIKLVSRRKERSPEGERFGDAMRRMRKERGLSQEALAEAATLTADYIGFIERGENVPTLTVILKVSIALNCTPAELLADFTPAALRRLKLI
jgi:transcriptional regulator with XRE-family HTH domain